MMRPWISNQPPGRIARWAAVVVLGLWLIWMAAAASGTTRKWPPDIAALAQSGDAFGSINALFTGLALIGLVYTVFLQRVELEDNRKSLQASRREQFLSARLNARTALLQAAAAMDEHERSVSALSTSRVRYVPSPKAVRSERFALEILLCEIHLGVSSNSWTPMVERAALRDYCLNRIEEVIMAFKGDDEGGGKHGKALVREFDSDFRLIMQRYQLNHLEFIKSISQLFNRIDTIDSEFTLRHDEIINKYTELLKQHDPGTTERGALIDKRDQEESALQTIWKADALKAAEDLKVRLSALRF